MQLVCVCVCACMCMCAVCYVSLPLLLNRKIKSIICVYILWVYSTKWNILAYFLHAVNVLMQISWTLCHLCFKIFMLQFLKHPNMSVIGPSFILSICVLTHFSPSSVSVICWCAAAKLGCDSSSWRGEEAFWWVFVSGCWLKIMAKCLAIHSVHNKPSHIY